MAFGTFNSTTMARPEDAPLTAKQKLYLEQAPSPTAAQVLCVPPERGTNAAGIPI